MEPIHLLPRTEVALPVDLIELAKDVQANILAVEPTLQRFVANNVIGMMGDPETINGLKKVYIKAVGAFVLTEGFSPLSDTDEYAVGKFSCDEAWRMKGTFRRLAFIEYSSLRSLCLKMSQPELMDVDTTGSVLENVDTKPLTMYIPVHAVETVLAA